MRLIWRMIDDRYPARRRHRQTRRMQPTDEAEHFLKCEACGGIFDMRDLGEVLDHEGPLPHRACDQARRRARPVSALAPLTRGMGPANSDGPTGR
jgi:hypothetical protein